MGGEADEDAAKMPQHPRDPREHAPPCAVPAMSAAEVAAVEEALGYRFKVKALVEEALTHGSYYYPYLSGVTYERLEFVGDSVINAIVAQHLFSTYLGLPPGPLTKLRAANVDKEKLARVAVTHGLHRFIRHKAPQLEGQIQEFMDDMYKYPIHSNGLLDPPKVLSDIVESLLGAIYVDSNSDQDKDSKFDHKEVWRVFRNLADPLISLETLGKHPVSELLELCQKTRRGLKIRKEEWAKNLTVEVLIDGEVVGSATYAQKKEIAQNRAAKAALDRLKETLGQSQIGSALAEASKSLGDLKVVGT